MGPMEGHSKIVRLAKSGVIVNTTTADLPPTLPRLLPCPHRHHLTVLETITWM